MKIKVTWDHIREGNRGNCCSCPVALAIKEHTQDFVKVGNDHIHVGYLTFITPKDVESFIWYFDHAYEEAQPFEFDLDLENALSV